MYLVIHGESMLAAEFGFTQPKSLNKLIIGDSPSSMCDWLEATAILKSQLPKNIQEIIDRCEKEHDYDSPEFEQACMFFYKHYVCRLDPWPQNVKTLLQIWRLTAL